jgi:ribosomal-protein-alanine N-acetyltransferase
MSKNTPFPHGLNVRLRPLKATDEDAFMQGLRNTKDLLKPWVQVPLTRPAFQRYVSEMKTADDKAFAVIRTDIKALAGVVEFRDIFYGHFQNAYVIYYGFNPHLKLGLMRQAVSLVIPIAFKRLKLHRLEANVQPDNLTSIALLRSCGFSKEGLSPRFLRKNGEWRDHERWALLSDGIEGSSLQNI